MSLRRKIVFGALATLGVLTAAAACAALWLSHMNPSPFVKAGIEAGTPSAAASSQHRYDISYSSEIIAGNDRDNPSGKTSTSVAFDDAWFAADGHVYNHALATTAMALSAAVNSESQYYGDAKGDVPYVEEALTALGFHDIDTSSFAKTSKTLDEVESLVKDEEDTVAYAFACKTLPAASDGNESGNGGPLLATAGEGGNADASDSSLPGADEAASWTLVFVGVRGTFGAEWLSDARVVDPYWSAATGDHTGYRLAELDVALALADYLESHELDASNTKLLVCGHSRGGSVANLLARDLLDIAEESAPVVAPENLFAYTFAPSASTREASAGDARYHSIYNVENPTDLVPRVPLAAWGYRCYGTTVASPEQMTKASTKRSKPCRRRVPATRASSARSLTASARRARRRAWRMPSPNGCPPSTTSVRFQAPPRRQASWSNRTCTASWRLISPTPIWPGCSRSIPKT